MKPTVSFVILSFNDADMVVRAVESIQKLKTKYKYNIFVVDNGSKDNTSEIVKKKCKGTTITKLKENVGTAAYDAAVKKSKSKYIYFTGCDIEVKSDMLDKLVDFLEKNEGVAQAAPKYLNIYKRSKVDLAGTWLSRAFYSGTFKKNVLGKKPIEIPYIGTGLLRRDFIKKFGYIFDNKYFFYGEDVDLGLRIRLSGNKVFYIPDSIVYHVGSVSRTIHRPAKLTYLMERNLLRTFFTSLSLLNILLYSIYVLGMRVFAILKDLLTLKFADAFARLRAILWVLLHPITIIKKRSQVQKMRTVDDSEVLKYFSEKHLFFK